MAPRLQELCTLCVADGEPRAQGNAVLAQRLGGNHRRELNHQPDAGVQIGMTEHLVKGEVVEGLDQFGVGLRQAEDVFSAARYSFCSKSS